MTNKNILNLCAALTILLFSASCNKNSADINPDLPISRLFVSSGTTAANSTSLSMFSPADEENLGPQINFNLVNPTGSGVIYNNIANIGFQIGMLNKQIRTFSINTDGTLRILNNFNDSTLVDGKAIAYNQNANQLYIASNTDSLIRIYTNASNKTGNIIADRTIKLDFRPWGIFYDSNNLFVVADLDVKKIISIKNIAPSANTLSFTELAIPTATRLHGITYSAKKDMLLVTDIGDINSNTDGAIYIFEGINAQLASNVNLTPTRTISGAATQLGNPVDISFDDRANKDIIYIAEKANSKILAFKLQDSGNIAPYTNTSLNIAPESIWVDAR